jgi:Zn-dependent oligopeptidase
VDECKALVVGRSTAMAAPGQSVRLPCAHMVCNGTPPVGGKPSLMTHNEVGQCRLTLSSSRRKRL